MGRLPYIDSETIEDAGDYLKSLDGFDWTVQVDPRTGIAYTRPIDFVLCGLSEEELDELGLGPDGEHMR